MWRWMKAAFSFSMSGDARGSDTSECFPANALMKGAEPPPKAPKPEDAWPKRGDAPAPAPPADAPYGELWKACMQDAVSEWRYCTLVWRGVARCQPFWVQVKAKSSRDTTLAHAAPSKHVAVAGKAVARGFKHARLASSLSDRAQEARQCSILEHDRTDWRGRGARLLECRGIGLLPGLLLGSI